MGMLLLEDKLTKVYNELVKIIPTEYGGWEEGDDNCDPVYDALYAAGLGNTSEVCSGASKVCAIIDGCDSVLKVPYSGSWSYTYEEVDEETGEVIQEEEEYFNWYDGADNSVGDAWDYCRSEYEIYEKAIEYGVDIFFPKTELFGYCQSGAIIKQEKVNSLYGKEEYKPSDDSIKKVEENRDFYITDKKWVALAIDVYGEEMVQKLVDFIDNVCHEVGEDLHGGNIGVRENGQPVILDFAGFFN